MQGAVVTGVAAIVHIATGSVNLQIALSLLLGSVPGILLGSRLAVRIPGWSVRVALIGMLGWSSYTLLLH